MLELERRITSAACDMSLEYARELTKTMYQLSFRLPDSNVERHVLLGGVSLRKTGLHKAPLWQV